jgi:hypothetical protein
MLGKKRDRFLVSEKTNGLRVVFCSLLVCGEIRSALLRRDCTLSSRPDLPSLDKQLVLDGELVFDTKLNRMTFVAFDVLLFGCRNLAKVDFATRVMVLQSVSKLWGTDPTTLPLVTKEWVPLSETNRRLESRMQTERGVRVFATDTNTHASDGFVLASKDLQLDKMGGCNWNGQLFKFKDPGELTVDLCINVEYLRRGLLTSELLVYHTCDRKRKRGDNVSDILHVDAIIGPHEATRILSILPPNRTNAVGEFYWKHSRWHFLFLRPDKRQANHPDTIKSTLVALQDHLSREQLLLQLCSRHYHRDLLQWQKTSVETAIGLLQQ